MVNGSLHLCILQKPGIIHYNCHIIVLHKAISQLYLLYNVLPEQLPTRPTIIISILQSMRLSGQQSKISV